MAHEQGELQAVYPVLRGRDDTRALAEQHDPQAAALASTMARLDILGLDSDEWRDGFAELAALLAKHVDAEEHTIFPRAQTAIGDAQAQALEAPFRDAYQQVIDSM
jgi:hemerythrin-like domain-containing protein